MLKNFIYILLLIMIHTVVTACSDKVQLQPLTDDSTILAFGDSLTYGTGTRHDKAYPAILQLLIKHEVINAGIPGEISSAGLNRLPSLLEKFKPDLIIICHGGNDILRKLDMKKTKSNIQQMIQMARDQNIQVVLIGVPEFGLFLSASPIYAELAEENRVTVDLNTLANILGKNALKSDHIHPNTKGYQLLAEDITKLLKQHGAL